MDIKDVNANVKSNGIFDALSSGDVREHDKKGSTAQLHPAEVLKNLAMKWDLAITDEAFAHKLDENDSLGFLRNDFCYPKIKELPYVDAELVDGEADCIYMVGSSLGLLPRYTEECIQRELKKWAQWGAHGHTLGEMPWAECDECIDHIMAKHIVGANPEEVAMMNGLSVNINLLMVSFFRPTQTRYKILVEDHAFPSDHYAMEYQLRFHNIDPSDGLLVIKPRKGEHCFRTEDILDVIEREGDSIAVVFLSAMQYYTGQLFEVEKITRAGQKKGCYVGWDLAHAVGNVEVKLHEWNVDFAAWCTYKYLNSGAGSIAGIFIHSKNFEELKDAPRFTGWWGNKAGTRFNMSTDIDLEDGAAGFRLSNPPPMLCACVEGSLKVFQKTTMAELRKKSILMTGYLEFLLNRHYSKPTDKEDTRPFTEIITPSDPEQRGAQLSVEFSVPVDEVFLELQKRGVACDRRQPNIIRCAPVAIYTKFFDVYRFVQLIGESMAAIKSDT